MVDIRKPIKVTEAINHIISICEQLPSMTIPLTKSYGHTLAEPIMSKHDVPPFNRSPYDGFAIRSKDSVGAETATDGIAFKVIDRLGAGQITNRHIGAFEAIRIMTGAAIPSHADAIVMLEQVEQKKHTFTIKREFQPFENVSFQGEDTKNGDILIESGSYIHPGTVALLATFGYARVKVYKKPIVGLLTTGAELLNVSAELQPGKIRDSNGPMIAAQLARMGIDSRTYDMVDDNLSSCLAVVKKALSETDCLITTGGVSVGDFDFLPKVYELLNADVLFNKIAMKPGSVTTVAVADGKFLFGLSGNPSSCYTGFELLVRPALLCLMGNKSHFLPVTRAILTEDFPSSPSFSRFIRSVYTTNGNQATVTPAGFNGPNAVSSIAKGNALLLLPANETGYFAGENADVFLLGTEAGMPEWLFHDI